MPACQVRAAARRLVDIGEGDMPVMQAIANSGTILANVNKKKGVGNVLPEHVVPGLLTRSERQFRALRKKENADLEAAVKSGKMSPSEAAKIKKTPPMLTASMI